MHEIGPLTISDKQNCFVICYSLKQGFVNMGQLSLYNNSNLF